MTILQKIRDWFHQKILFEATHLIKQEINTHLSQNNYFEAEKLLNRLTELAPNEEEGWINLSKVQFHQNKLDEGYQALQQAIALNPQNTLRILEFVNEYENLGKREQSSDMLYSAIQKTPDMLELRLHLAQQFYEDNQFEKAAIELQEILNRDSGYLEAHVGLTHCYIGLGRKVEALSQISQIRQCDEKRADELISLVYENIQNFN